MKKSKIILLTLFSGIALILSACVPGPRVTGAPGIALKDDLAVVAYANFVYGIDVNDGKVSWQYPDEVNRQLVFFAPPLVTEDYVYIGDLENNFNKLDRESGDLIWSFDGSEGYYVGEAAEKDGVVFAPCNDGYLYALDQDGDLLWKFETGHYLWAQPLILDEMIFISGMDHFVYALTMDGEKVWSHEMMGAVVGAPTPNEDGSVIFVGSLGDEVVALDVDDGDEVWRFETSDSVWGAPVINDGSLYFADSAGTVYALLASEGTPIWETEYEYAIAGGFTLLSDGLVFATKEGVIKALDFEGKPIWESNLDGEIYQAPSSDGEFIVTGTINGEELIYGFNLDGVQLWSMTPEN